MNYSWRKPLKTEHSLQWLTTAPNPSVHRGSPFWNEYDQGQRGWRLHAIHANESETLTQVRGRAALCGLRPAHGWSLDFFIEQKCARCEMALTRSQKETQP